MAFDDDPIPTSIDRYTVLRKLAVGGMAELFLAKQRGLEGFEKVVVLKRILKHLAEDNEFVSMFLDEARIAAKLSHPNIVQIYDLGKDDDTYYIAMEYVSGRNVQHIMNKQWEQKKFVPVEHACRIIAGVCEGLHYAHSRKDFDGRPLAIVHRDISPQNILVSFAGGVKVVDFGIAKASTQLAQTRAGVLKGKYAYMSPEQVRGQTIDHRSDLFAVGLVLYEMLTGRRAFERDSSLKTLKAIVSDKPVNPLELNPELPPAVVTLLSRALAKNPDRRYANAQEFQLAIEDFLESSPRKSNAVRLSRYVQDLFEEELSSGNGTMVVEGVGAIVVPTGASGVAPPIDSEEAVDSHTLSAALALHDEEEHVATVFPEATASELAPLPSAVEAPAKAPPARVGAAPSPQIDDRTLPVSALVMGSGHHGADPSDLPTRAAKSLVSLDAASSDDPTLGEGDLSASGNEGVLSNGQALSDSADDHDFAGPTHEQRAARLLAKVDALVSEGEELTAERDAASTLASDEATSLARATSARGNAQPRPVSRAQAEPERRGEAQELPVERSASSGTGLAFPRQDAAGSDRPLDEGHSSRGSSAAGQGIRPAARPRRTLSQHRVPAASLARPDSPPPLSDEHASGGALAAMEVVSERVQRSPDPSAAVAWAPDVSLPGTRPRENVVFAWLWLAGLSLSALAGVALHIQLGGPAAQDATTVAVRLMRIRSLPVGAQVSYGNLSQEAPAVFVVPTGVPISVRLSHEGKSKSFQIEVPSGEDAFEQTLVLEN